MEKNRIVWLPDGVKSLMFSHLDRILACDGQTDRQTDRQTSCDSIIHAMCRNLR